MVETTTGVPQKHRSRLVTSGHRGGLLALTRIT